MKQIDRFVLIELDGKVRVRCYTGSTFVDADITTSALALLVSDGARLLCAIHQKLSAAAPRNAKIAT